MQSFQPGYLTLAAPFDDRVKKSLKGESKRETRYEMSFAYRWLAVDGDVMILQTILSNPGYLP
jgi:hypothetical protein